LFTIEEAVRGTESASFCASLHLRLMVKNWNYKNTEEGIAGNSFLN
jgi:hypothetical protein